MFCQEPVMEMLPHLPEGIGLILVLKLLWFYFRRFFRNIKAGKVSLKLQNRNVELNWNKEGYTISSVAEPIDSQLPPK
jgi:hypothetical protein